MRHSKFLPAALAAVVVLLAGLPAEGSTSSQVVPSEPRVVVTASVPVFGCDMPIPAPFTKYMSKFTRTGNCWERYWTLRGWVEPGVDARQLLKSWRSWLNTSAYYPDGSIGCRWKGSVRVCGQLIGMYNGLGYGGITTKVGPIRDDGTRSAMVQVRVGYGS